jgi:enoyl-CoA hydratase/carnithine racemase
MTAERAKLEIDERGDGVAITLAGGDTGNYLGTEELGILSSALGRAEESGKRWVLLAQKGRDFCLGRAPEEGGEELREALIGFVQRMQALELITLAAADGGCAGFGVGLFALTDISVAANGCWFQFPEILHGPAPAIVASWLYDRVPYKQGLYWTMTGSKFDSGDAHRFGLASKVVPAAELAGAAQEAIDVLESLSPDAVRNAKSAARVMSAAPQDLAVRRAMALKWFR